MTDEAGRRALSRRALLLGTAAALAGCARERPSDGGGDNNVPISRLSPVVPPVAPPAYAPPAGEALPNFKLTAGLFAQRLATYDAAGRAPSVAAPSGYMGGTPALSMAAGPLLTADRWSRAEVEVVQYGGLSPVTPRARSGVALVVLRQVLQSRTGETVTVRRTLDLRLSQRAGAWQIEALASAGGTAVGRPADLPAAAQAVLDDRRIDLPDSARWDVYSGQIAPELLEVLLRLADVAPLRATVLKTGHPERVVDGRAAPPVSAHWLGRAVDIHTVGGVPVAAAADAGVRRLVETAGALPQVAQVGAPAGFDLDGGGRRYFSNLVHADHLHIAVRGSATSRP